MKTSYFYAFGSSLLLFFSCGQRSATEIKNILPQFEIVENKDTINYLDVNGLKQGHWIAFEVGMSSVNAGVNFCPEADTAQHRVGSWQNCSGKTKIEEGFYRDDKKIGYWKRFAKDGSIKDSVEYKTDS